MVIQLIVAALKSVLTFKSREQRLYTVIFHYSGGSLEGFPNVGVNGYEQIRGTIKTRDPLFASGNILNVYHD
ncbi:TPA: hypothetical protein ACTXXA_002742 [Legionella anisa]